MGKRPTIAFIVRDLPYLKLLTSLMHEMHNKGIRYNLYHMDCYKGIKEYNRPTMERLLKSSAAIVNNASKTVSFANDDQLFKALIADGIRKAVSVEIGLCGTHYANQFKKNNIKTFSLFYLTDSMWSKKDQTESLFRVYYTSKYIMEMQQKITGLVFNASRDRCLGSPIFDQLKSIDNSKATSTLIMLPNQCDPKFFGGEDGFAKIIRSFGDDLVFKTRQKQWMPKEVQKSYKDIVFDGDIMYPSAVVNTFARTKNTVIFYSSGVYESIFANQYVINVKFPLSRWVSKVPDTQKDYFFGPVYNYDGVIECVEQQDLINGNFKIQEIDQKNRKEWIEKHIGDVSEESSELIVDDIISN